ncbi:MurR/RpiR family transcriptional regulator [Tissierella sp. MSJ-40]|uniref:MurR/RpiR family transcriptional regulator n=1 Tax=Tissierella simiarum TaxID=2841534 RepID=A0ABS6E3R4_9FIRM|nr:MurR/RpiR family transcriptional regulator [Tissierella simiarum]MBU5436899.1 MurR/RpiR family transcriptional regulator [Tissierella simiarum]
MSSILRIKNLLNELTDIEKVIADFILENQDEVYNLTANELAEITNTSPASVIRFSKKVGYSGFQELKIALAKDIPNYEIDENSIYEAITIHDSTMDIMNKVAMENMKAIKDTLKLLDEKTINEAVDAISNAKRINLYGVGVSSLVALDFQYKLVRINKDANIHMDHHLQLVSASNMSEKDVAIGISHSGKTIETYKALEISRKRGAKTISITKYGDNPVSKVADIKIFTTEVEKHLRMGAVASRIAQLTIIDILFMNIVKKNFNIIPEYIQETGKIIENLRIKE